MNKHIYLAEEIRRVATAESISVRAVVGRLLNNGLSPESPAVDERCRPHQSDGTPVPPAESKVIASRMADPKVKFLLSELWDGWSLFTINAGFLPYAFGTKLAKVKTLFAYEKLLQILGTSPDQYPLDLAIADAFNDIWSGTGEQPSSKSESGTIE